MQELHTTVEVMAALGGDTAVATITGRKVSAVWNWKKFQTFPADTYVAMTTALAGHGHFASPALWRQVGVPAHKDKAA